MVSCTNCGLDAPLRCGGCKDAPSYHDGEELNVSYCSRECQKADWPRHKKACNNMRRRKSLLRTATLLKTTMMSYREALYDWDLIKIEPRDKALILKHDRKRPSWNNPVSFPDHLTSNPEHKEAALLKRMALHCVSILGPMARTLLRGLVSHLDTVVVRIANPPYPATMDPPDAAFFDAFNPNVHKIVLATLEASSEKWVIDITGCQFGFKGALFPLEEYMVEKQCTFIETTRPWTETEISDQLEILALDGMPPPGPMADIMRTTGYRRHFAALVKEHVNSSLIKGCDAEFESKLIDFSQNVKTHMSICRSGN